jgi:2-enoate reductase
MQSIFRKGKIECLVNPRLGREKEMEILPTKHPRKVLVIGGGPAGLNVAWVAASRGHDVSLYEKESHLGGQLVLGSISSFKKEMKSLIHFQKKQIEKYSVRCHLNVDVSIDIIKEQDPDVIILATGSIPMKPPVAGLDSPIVFSVPQIFNGVKQVVKNTVVIGGGATGCEVALHLSEEGCHVSLVEILPKIGAQIESMTRKLILKQLRAHGVRMLTEYGLKKITETGVLLLDKTGKEVFLECDSVIIAIGSKPNTDLFEQTKTLGKETYYIGDCLESRSAKEAIFEGTSIGISI